MSPFGVNIANTPAGLLCAGGKMAKLKQKWRFYDINSLYAQQ